jgi:hypothetical protein
MHHSLMCTLCVCPCLPLHCVVTCLCVSFPNAPYSVSPTFAKPLQVLCEPWRNTHRSWQRVSQRRGQWMCWSVRVVCRQCCALADLVATCATHTPHPLAFTGGAS